MTDVFAVAWITRCGGARFEIYCRVDYKSKRFPLVGWKIWNLMKSFWYTNDEIDNNKLDNKNVLYCWLQLNANREVKGVATSITFCCSHRDYYCISNDALDIFVMVCIWSSLGNEKLWGAYMWKSPKLDSTQCSLLFFFFWLLHTQSLHNNLHNTHCITILVGVQSPNHSSRLYTSGTLFHSFESALWEALGNT